MAQDSTSQYNTWLAQYVPNTLTVSTNQFFEHHVKPRSSALVANANPDSDPDPKTPISTAKIIQISSIDPKLRRNVLHNNPRCLLPIPLLPPRVLLIMFLKMLNI